jgi:uncharacterized membrane protein
MDLLARLSLAAAVFTTGIMAGLYFAYSLSVMPALAGAGDRTVVETMQRVNVAILNAPFGLAFGGALVAGLVAIGAHLAPSVRAARPGVTAWLIVGVALYAVTLAVTFVVNVPLNDALAAAGSAAGLPEPALHAARVAFERPWVVGNAARTVASCASFGCLLRALTKG